MSVVHLQFSGIRVELGIGETTEHFLEYWQQENEKDLSKFFFDKKNYYDPASPPTSEDGEMDNITDFTDWFYSENLYSIDQMSIRGTNLLESKRGTKKIFSKRKDYLENSLLNYACKSILELKLSQAPKEKNNKVPCIIWLKFLEKIKARIDIQVNPEDFCYQNISTGLIRTKFGDYLEKIWYTNKQLAITLISKKSLDMEKIHQVHIGYLDESKYKKLLSPSK